MKTVRRSVCRLTAVLFLAAIAASAQTPVITFNPNLGTYPVGEIQFALTASGGNGTYAWSITGGSLPPGISLRTDVPSFFPPGTSAGLIGVATTPGTYNFIVSVLSGGSTTTQACTIRITNLALKDLFNLPNAFVGASYSYSLTPLNAAGPVTFNPTSAMPAGLAFSSLGVISGIPASAGSTTVNFSMTDGVDTIFRSLRINVFAVRFTTTALLPNATQGVPYNTPIVAAGGTGAFNYTTGGGLPSGLTFNSSGVISGTTNASPGRYGFSVTATDTASSSFTRTFSIDVLAVPETQASISLGNLIFHAASIGFNYSRLVNVINGGVAPFTWSATGLPPGMSVRTYDLAARTDITPDDGDVWGTPTAVGTFNVQLTVTDATGATTTIAFPFTVSPLGVDGSDTLPGGTIGAPYNKKLRVLGGTGPYTLSQITSLFQPLPSGLSLNTGTFTVSGTPLENGSFPVNIRFQDAVGNVVDELNNVVISGGSSTININQNFNLGTAPLGGYSFQISACCTATNSFTWSVQSGTLPPGINLSPSGLLNGSLTTTGTYLFTIQATDNNNAANFGRRQFQLIVTPLNYTGPTTLPFANVGTAYSQNLLTAITGASGSVTPALQFGSFLPPGLTLSGAGDLSGTPTATGRFNFNLVYTDSAANTLIRTFTVNVYPAGTIPPLSLNFGPVVGPNLIGVVAFQLPASGGVPPYHFSYSPGAAVIPGMRVLDGPPLPTSFPATVTGGFAGVILNPGVYTTSLRVTDSASNTFDRPITWTVVNTAPLAQGSLPKALLGSPYSFTFTGFGGSANYSWTATNLPRGLSMSSGGTVSGTPTAAGTFGATITLTDNTNHTSIGFGHTLIVNPFDVPTPGVLPAGQIGVPYSQHLTATGCGAGCVGSLVSGSLPSGLALSADGLLSGTPTGFYNSGFLAQATGANGTVQKEFSLRINFNTIQPLLIANGPVFGPNNLNNTIASSLSAQGGTPPYTWSLVSGSLPPGISLAGPGESLGANLLPGFTYLAGRVMQAGTYSFTLKVTDAASATATNSFTWQVLPISINITSFPITGNPLVYNTAYSQQLLVLGGSGSYPTWAIASGSLPPGLTLNTSTGVVSGTATNTGSFTAGIQVTDSLGTSITQNVTFTVFGPTGVVVNPGNPDSITFQMGFTGNNSWNPSGGTGPYSYTALTPLPPGCAIESGSSVLSNTGSLAAFVCTPMAAGDFTFTIRINDSAGNFGIRTLTLHVAPFTLFSSTTLPNGSVGFPYSTPLITWDAASTVTWSLLAGSALPPGLNIGAGVIGGTPTAAGSYSFTLTATDSSGVTLNFTFNIVISTIHITTPDIIPQQAITNVPYTFTMTAIGGAGAYTWTASGLPGGLSLSTSGTISGTPTASGTFRITVTVTDGSSTYTRPFTLFAHFSDPAVPSLTVFATKLADVRVGQSTSATLSPTGGVPPFSWAVAPGSSLPPGLALYTGTSLNVYSSNQTVGLTYLQGAPTTVGTYSFDLIATDSLGATCRRTFTLNVSPMAVFSSGLKTATTNVAYSQQITAVGGTPPYSFTYDLSGLATDMLPPGFNASPTGLISGTTTSTGAFGFMATAHDAAGHTFTLTYNLPVTNAFGLEVTTSLPSGVRAGIGFSTTLFTNGASTYTWSVTAGALPPGVTLLGSVLTGPASAAGIYNFTVRATDTANPSNFADRAYTLRVQPMQANTHRAATLPVARTGVSYSQQLDVAGGTPPYTFSTTPLSPVPPGLALSANGILSGVPTATGSFSFTYIVTDSTGAQGYLGTPTLNVLAPGAPVPLQGVTATLDQASTGGPYTAQLDSLLTGGTPPFTWTVDLASTLPPGMSILPGSNGVSSYLGGIPAATGTYRFTLIATDSAGRKAQNPLTLVVNQVAASPATFPNGVVGTPYSATFTGSGGTSPYTFTLVTATNLPPGLSLSSTGTLSGTPTLAGLFSVAVTVMDSVGNRLTARRFIVIDNPAGQAQGIEMPDTIRLSYILGSAAPAATPVNVTRTTGTLPFTAAVEGIPGVSLSSTAGSAPATLNLNLNTSGLTLGTYAGVVAVNSAQSANLFTQTPVVLSVINPVHLLVSAPATVAAHASFNVVVTAVDASNNVVPGYAGTIAFTSTDGIATLPANLTLVNGSATVPATLNTLGNQTLTATDIANAAVTGTSGGISVQSLPVLRIIKSHTGNFTQGQLGAQYTLTVTNIGTTATSGTVTVTETAPTGLVLTGMAGNGWTCPSPGNTCTRADALPLGTAYPPITATVNVASNAATLVTNQASASGGGSATAIATDPTTITTSSQTGVGLRFVPITPCRVADTRRPDGPLGGPSIAGGTSRDFIVPNSTCGVPANAQAYSLNVAVVPGGPLGFLTVFPTGQSRPVASTLNSIDGRIKSNAAIVPAGAGGAISVYASNPTNVIVDINGYFVPATDPTALAFYPVVPCRIADTRKPDAPLAGPVLSGGGIRTFPILSSTCGIPASAKAYSLNFAAVPAGPLGFITAWPSGQLQPGVASLNALTGTVTANAVIVPSGVAGSIDIFATNPTHLVIDINGYFAPPGAGGLSLYNVTPCRVADTRQPPGTSAFTGQKDLPVSGGLCGLPVAPAYVLSATVVPPGALGFLTLWPQGQSRPTVATLNALDAAVTSNLALVPATNGSISSFVSNASHLIVDAFGYFAP